MDENVTQCYQLAECIHKNQLCVQCKGNEAAETPLMDFYEEIIRTDGVVCPVCGYPLAPELGGAADRYYCFKCEREVTL